MPAAEMAALCRRVTTTKVIIRASPGWPGSPSGTAGTLRSPTSAVGRARVPSLSFSRCSVIPSASRDTRNGASVRLPAAAPCGRANATAIAESMAEQNHFSPDSRQLSPVRTATVLVRERSEPPWDSVIHWPLVIAVSGSVETRRGSQASRTAGSISGRDSSAAAPSVIATGQLKVAHSGPYRCSRACCTTRAPAPQRPRASSRCGNATRACSAAARRSRSQPGAVSTRSTRLPQPSYWTNRGGWASASRCASRSGPATSRASRCSAGAAAAWPSPPSNRSSHPRNTGSPAYLCGLTVQSGPHIGHLRSGVNYDVLRRWLVHSGYDVTFIRNITDIDDKVLAKSVESGEPFWSIAYANERILSEAYDTLGVLAPTYEPRATGHVPEMHELIKHLIDKGYAYVAEDGSGDVYFDVRSFAGYGALSGQRPEAMQAAEDGPERAKRDPRDFALWKGAKAGEPVEAGWPSPWGTGRPGW